MYGSRLLFRYKWWDQITIDTTKIEISKQFQCHKSLDIWKNLLNHVKKPTEFSDTVTFTPVKKGQFRVICGPDENQCLKCFPCLTTKSHPDLKKRPLVFYKRNTFNIFALIADMSTHIIFVDVSVTPLNFTTMQRFTLKQGSQRKTIQILNGA